MSACFGIFGAGLYLLIKIHQQRYNLNNVHKSIYSRNEFLKRHWDTGTEERLQQIHFPAKDPQWQPTHQPHAARIYGLHPRFAMKLSSRITTILMVAALTRPGSKHGGQGYLIGYPAALRLRQPWRNGRKDICLISPPTSSMSGRLTTPRKAAWKAAFPVNGYGLPFQGCRSFSARCC